jgi:Family of unknown function (DUF6152)
MAGIVNAADKIKATGKLTSVVWTNPHIALEIDLPDGAGTVAHWKLEGSAPHWYTQAGFTKADFTTAIGKDVTIVYLKALDGSKYGVVEQITFPNGITAKSSAARNQTH